MISCFKNYSVWMLALAWLLICVLGRIIPHPYGLTPLTSLSLCAGFFFKRWQGVLVAMLSLMLSDIVIAALHGYAVWGNWSVFTYTALLIIVLAGSLLKKIPNISQMLCCTLGATLFYWAWTNFGTWLMVYDMYPHTIGGLGACMVAGLPFLKDALVGNLAWSMAIYYVMLRSIGRDALQHALFN